MKHDTKSVIVGVLAAFLVVTLAAFAGASARADGPSKLNYADLEQIKKNQIVIEKTRQAHVDFVVAKGDNEDRVKLLAQDGWNVNWSNMTLEPSFQ